MLYILLIHLKDCAGFSAEELVNQLLDEKVV